MTYIQKTKAELLAVAKELDIKNRGQMDKASLLSAIWEELYGKQENFVPKNNDECMDYLLMHPNDAIKVVTHLWMTIGGVELVEILGLIAKCRTAVIFAERSIEDKKQHTLHGSQLFKETVRLSSAEISHVLEKLSHNLNMIAYRFYAENSVSQWQGTILYIVPCHQKEELLDTESSWFQAVFTVYSDRPSVYSGWIMLEEHEIKLAENFIKDRWMYSPTKMAYSINKSDVESLRDYLMICKSAFAKDDLSQ